MTTDAIVKVEGLGVAFDTPAGRRTVLSGLDLTIRRGECLAIVGPNGAGKTVLTNALLGRYNAARGVHLAGRIEVCGVDLLSLDPRALRRLRAERMSAIFQDFSHTLNPIRSIGGQLRQMQRLAGATDADPGARLAAVNFPAESVGDRPHQLSQGMKQRALVALALANRPDLVIADEVTSALDVINQQVVFELITGEQRSRPDMAIVFVCHDTRLVRQYADRVVVVSHGRITDEGDPSRVTPALGLPAARDAAAALDEAPVLLDARAVSKSFKAPFRRPRRVLHSLDLRIRHREHTAIIGASGSGKTTLANLLAGVLPIDDRETGAVTFDGIDLRGLHRPDHALRHRIQMVFQDPDAAIGSIDPRLTVEQVILEPRLAREPDAREAGRRWVAEKLAAFGLRDLAQRRAAHLSGGQRQRVEILRAFHGLRTDCPTLMIADEPTSMLDPAFVGEVVDIFVELGREYDVTYLFITHSLELMRATCRRVAVMFDGEFVEQAPVDRLTLDPLHPYARLLLRAGRETRHPGGDPELQRFRLPDAPGGCPARSWCRLRSDLCTTRRPRLQRHGDRDVACHHPADRATQRG